MQDGNMAKSGQWLITSYDAIGRVAYTSLTENMGDVSQEYIENNVKRVRYEDGKGYTPSMASLRESETISKKFYDTYDFISSVAKDNNLSYIPMVDFDVCYTSKTCPTRSAQGMMTGSMTRTLVEGNAVRLYASFFYDHNGRLIQSHEQNIMGGYDHCFYKLSFTGKPVSVKRVHTTADTTVTDVLAYSYDGMDRLVSVSSSHDGEGMKRLNHTSYDRTGRIESLQLGTSANGRIGYRYDVRGWPTAIISPHFTQELYYSNDSKGNNNPCFNGNISAVWWEGKDAIYAERSTSHHYAFDYDYKNRLVKASYIQTGSKEINGGLIIGNQADYSCEYAYDLNGNITSLTRNGVAMSVQAFDFKCWNFGMIDDAKFEYDGNQLIRAYDDCESLTYAAAMDFKARTAKSNQYSWDANGNMTSDMNRNITKITYNFLNLPYEIHFADGHINRYTYTSDGRKLRVEYMISNTGVIDARDYGEFSSSPLPSRVNEVPNSAIEGTFNDTHDAVSLQTIMTKSYCGDLEYLNNEIERVDNDYGYWAGGRYHYYIKDYQGNVRAVIDEAGRLEEVNNYYPYGGLMGAAGSGVQSRKYGGKELDRENGLDWYDSQARHYDPTAGRTPTMDSKAESFYSMTPYLWCAGNPVRNIDPTGEELIVMGSDEARQIYLDMIYNSTGSIYAFDDKNHMFLKNTDLNFRGKSSQTLRTLINSAIDSETEYSFSLTGDLMDDETVFIDSYITKQLDISDLMIIGKTSTALQGALIGHQINEIMVGGDYQTAHDISLKKEGVIYGELVGDHSISSRTDVPTVPDRPLDNIFQYNEEHSYLLQSGGTFTTERIGSKGTTITVIRNGELKKVKKL
jgi:RHS repeat-associated protein